MKVKFIKEYRALQSDVYDIYEVGTIENMPETAAQWLIDNGFAEEVKEPKWVRKCIKGIDFTREKDKRFVTIGLRFIKDFYYLRWCDSLSANLIEKQGKGVAESIEFDRGDNFSNIHDDIDGLNQLIRNGYIEIEDNPNIVWEDNDEN